MIAGLKGDILTRPYFEPKKAKAQREKLVRRARIGQRASDNYIDAAQASKPLFHLVNLDQIVLQAVSSTALVRRCAKALRDKSLSSVQSAQVNHGSQLLLLDQADPSSGPSTQCIDDAPMEICGSHFNRMTWEGPGIEAVEPAGT